MPAKLADLIIVIAMLLVMAEVFINVLARMFHEWSTSTADMGILPGVLGFSFDGLRTSSLLRRTVQVRLGCKTLRLPGGIPISKVS
jgi:hypothetical protein